MLEWQREASRAIGELCRSSYKITERKIQTMHN